ncbi:hypothetical protein E2C01_043472 [Portunus trituberculatus]|uniref:Uncharacterized protein n=1 Tax=Portunus trituberculatus TaxID=210409 RepID=A0A5B7FT27_PORTR|nr:hypothetical protein [Portunus trituberculatus]
MGCVADLVTALGLRSAGGGPHVLKGDSGPFVPCLVHVVGFGPVLVERKVWACGQSIPVQAGRRWMDELGWLHSVVLLGEFCRMNMFCSSTTLGTVYPIF